MNFTGPLEFFILSLSESPSYRIPLFLIFLIIYLTTAFGNMMILIIILLDRSLHYPMYFLLWNFSIMDFAFSSNSVPGMLASIVSKHNSISFYSCMTQVFFFHAFGNSENLLLSVMALDRYIAICYPLRYSTLMNRETCVLLCCGCCACASLHALLHVVMTSLLKFHRSLYLPHYFCDIPPLLEITTSDTYINQLLIYTEGSVVALIPTLLVLLSYINIGVTILHIHSSLGRQKAFSTCVSHLTVFLLFSASAVSMYFKPLSVSFPRKGRAVTLMYTAITPMFNPYIYCLRNKEVKVALKKRFRNRKEVGHVKMN